MSYKKNHKNKNSKIYYERLFPRTNAFNYSKLKIGREEISYITTPIAAKAICDIIKKYSNDLRIKFNRIIDCTACVGGDTLAFANEFPEVLSVEIDKSRFEMLQNNVTVYGLKNVKLINDDCLKVLASLDRVDIIYFDPPWGGSDYKYEDKMRLSINNLSIEDICIDILTRKYVLLPPRLIIIKVPKNYDLKYFFDKVTIKDNMLIYLHKLKKINLLVVVNRYSYNKYVLID